MSSFDVLTPLPDGSIARQTDLQWRVYWAPEGRCIATVWARTAKAAIRKAPQSYRRYLGEMYAEEVGATS